eukprot:scaffold17209_cov60-Attheya_sp.AAC.2
MAPSVPRFALAKQELGYRSLHKTKISSKLFRLIQPLPSYTEPLNKPWASFSLPGYYDLWP